MHMNKLIRFISFTVKKYNVTEVDYNDSRTVSNATVVGTITTIGLLTMYLLQYTFWKTNVETKHCTSQHGDVNLSITE